MACAASVIDYSLDKQLAGAFNLSGTARRRQVHLTQRMITMETSTAPDPQRKKEELRSFIFLTAVMVPVLSVAVVGGYGFIVWMIQLVAGPPAH